MDAAIAGAVRPRRFPSALIDRFTLADGREVVVRPVLAFDADAEQDFVRGLSADTRRKRFHFNLRELSPSLLRAMTEVDHDAHVAIVAEALLDDDDTAKIVADARYVRSSGAGLADGEAEFAIAVADAWQGAGLGGALLKRLARHAARQGVRVLVGDVLPGNRAMFSLAATLGGEPGGSPSGPGVMRTRLALAAPSRYSSSRSTASSATG